MPHLRPRGSRYTTLPTRMPPRYLPVHLIPSQARVPACCSIPHVNAMGHASPACGGPSGHLFSLALPASLPLPPGTCCHPCEPARPGYMGQAPPRHAASSLPPLPACLRACPLRPLCCDVSSGNASLLPSRLPLLLPHGPERPEHQHLRLSPLPLRTPQADQDAYPSPHFHPAQVYWRDPLPVCYSHARPSLGSHKRARTQRDPSAQAGPE